MAARTVRAALKEPLRAQAASRNAVYFRKRDWKDGQRLNPVTVTDLLSAKKSTA